MRLIFAGTPEVAAETLETIAQKHDVVLVITRPDAPMGRSGTLTPAAVAITAERLGLEVLKTNSLGVSELAQIESANADLGIVVAFGALIRQPVLGALPWWNLHFSLLPSWRGASPLQHSILAAGDGAGITVFQLDEGLDTGPIIASRPLSIADHSYETALPLFGAAGADLLLEAMANMPTPTAQSGPASYAPKISRSDAKLDFSKPAVDLQQRVRAFNPEPMAWASYRGSPLRIISASVWPAEFSGSIGEITLIDESVIVGCAENTALRLETLQPAGKKPMRAIDWYRGNRGGRFD